MNVPQPSRDDIVPHLERMSRKPFQEVLATFLEAQPTKEAIKSMAEQSPEKWANSTKSVAHMAGYADKTEVQTNFYMELRTLGDAELLQMLAEMEADMKIINQKAEVVPEDSEFDFNERAQREPIPSPEPGLDE